MGYLVDSGTHLYRSWFKEMSFLLGFEVQYQYVINYNTSDFAETEKYAEYSDPIKTNIIFEENPKVKTLKTLGWYSENKEDSPIIAYLAFDVPNLTVESKLTIPPFQEIRTSDKVFVVKDITTNLQFPDCWVVKLAPEYSTSKTTQQVITQEEENQDSGFTFLRPKTKHNDQINATRAPEEIL